MKTQAAAIYGQNDVRLREFELPPLGDDELLVKVISDSVCLSTWKAAKLGANHKRVPDNVAEHPAITGHECAGIIEQVGKNLQQRYRAGQRFVLQPAMGLPSGYSAGYSYEYFGGNATYMIIPQQAVELGCVLPYEGSYFAAASLAEPMCCIIGAYHANYHTTQYVYEHRMGIKPGGNVALLASAGPMGIGAIDYAINGNIRPARVVVVDIDEARLARARLLLPESVAREKGVELVGDDLLAENGCLNFFAGPTDSEFKVPFNFYNVHYASTHVVGTSGGSTGDMLEALQLTAEGRINPSVMITHIGGLDAVPETIINLPSIPGGKKLIYNFATMPLTAITDFPELGKTDPFYARLAELVAESYGVWNEQAERFLLQHFGVETGV